MPAIPSPRAGRKPRLEIIPFIDIMFFLLATFMMVSLSMIQNQGLELNLPKAGTAKPQETVDHTQTVSVTQGGEIYLGQELVALETLPARFDEVLKNDPEVRLVLQGDYDCPYGRVVEVFDIARGQGVTRLVIRTEKREAN